MTFTYIPDFPVEEKSEPFVRAAEFGGYSQRALDGIHMRRDTWSLQFSAKSATDRNNIVAYLETKAGRIPFQWTTPFGETAQFTCPSWDTSFDSCALNTVRATFELAYVPGQTNLPATPIDSAVFSWIPDFPATRRFDTNRTQLRLGDGYTQNIAFGLNPQGDTWTLQFKDRTNTERDAIRDYLRGAARVSSFQWQTPLGNTARFICKDWTVRYEAFNKNSLSLTFIRVFEPPSPLIYGYAQGVNKLIQLTYIPGAASLPGAAPGSNLQITTSYTPGVAVGAFLFSISITYTPGAATGGTGGGQPSTGGDGAAYWSDWRPFDDEVFFYGEEAAVSGDMPAYWNRWQSWTEDPPLIFEESP